MYRDRSHTYSSVFSPADASFAPHGTSQQNYGCGNEGAARTDQVSKEKWNTDARCGDDLRVYEIGA